MLESKDVIKIRVINWIAEKKVERTLLTKKLSSTEQEKLYLDTFNQYKQILKDFD